MIYVLLLIGFTVIFFSVAVWGGEENFVTSVLLTQDANMDIVMELRGNAFATLIGAAYCVTKVISLSH